MSLQMPTMGTPLMAGVIVVGAIAMLFLIAMVFKHHVQL